VTSPSNDGLTQYSRVLHGLFYLSFFIPIKLSVDLTPRSASVWLCYVVSYARCSTVSSARVLIS